MSFSDELQEYLLVRPPQSTKPGKRSSQNLQIQRLLPLIVEPKSPGKSPKSPTLAKSPTLPSAPRRRILPILNLVSHAIRKTRVTDSDNAAVLCKFDREPRGVLGKWQVDMRRGEGGGWIFVGKYERYEWAREVPTPGTPSTPKFRSATPSGSTSKGNEITWKLVRSTYSRSKSIQALSTSGRKPRKASVLSDPRTVRASMDDTSPERRLSARIIIAPNSPPSMVVVPRNPRSQLGVEEGAEEANKEEVLDALIQGLWIVWREGVVDDMHLSGRNTWSREDQREQKRGFLDALLCRS
jgi:hypothetical protein